jgi:hypothetical protein
VLTKAEAEYLLRCTALRRGAPEWAAVECKLMTGLEAAARAAEEGDEGA